MQLMASMENHTDEFIRSVENVSDMAKDLSAEGLFALGYWLQGLDQVTKATECYQKLLIKSPHFYQALFNLGVMNYQRAEPSKAIDYFKRALDINPGLAQAWSSIGIIECEQYRFDEALVCLEKALAINPNLATAHYHMGVVLQNSGRYPEAMRSYQSALVCDPGFAPARWLSLLSLPILYDNEAQIEQYRRQFSTGLETLINSTKLNTHQQKQYALQGIGTGTNFYLQYQGRNDLDLQTRYGEFVHQVMAANYPHWVSPKQMPPLQAGEKIRIGYVSSFMYDHTVGVFLSGWVHNHDVSTFDIHCYHMGDKVDALTKDLEKHSRALTCFNGNVEAAARKIESDRLHILVHTDIGMHTQTMQLAALRLAPVQCKGWGHPVTTGLPTIDYYLTSDLMEPKKGEQHYSESLVRLPNLALCYRQRRLPTPPKTRGEMGISEKRFVFLSTQSLFKYLPQYDAVYPEIARKVPNACFVFIANQSPKVTGLFMDRLRKAFRRYGLDADQYCHLSPRLNGNDFLNLNLSANVLLDTFEWSGGKTTLEAIGCGLPVVTCPGRFMRGRHTYAMLKMMGLTETIAADKAAYCRLAVRLANDRNFYSAMRHKVRQHHHRLYGDKRFIDGLEEFYTSVVRQRLTREKSEYGKAQNDA